MQIIIMTFSFKIPNFNSKLNNYSDKKKIIFRLNHGLLHVHVHQGQQIKLLKWVWKYIGVTNLHLLIAREFKLHE